MAAKLVCSKQCESLVRQLEQRRWCPGNGGCGLLRCNCDKLRTLRNAEHDECLRLFRVRLAVSELKLKTKADKAQAGDFHSKAFQND
jgi:hypothetical protein